MGPEDPSSKKISKIWAAPLLEKMVNAQKIIKRFGVRYGKSLKLKVGKIEAMQREKHKCPYCSAPKVKRISAGIWECKKCGAKFTGKAYTIKKTIKKEVKEE